MSATISPLVTNSRWGAIEVGTETFRDAKLSPDGAAEWDWRATNTHHVPGIQIADVAELVHLGSTIVILSRGFELVLQVPQATIDWLAERNITYEVRPRDRALQRARERERERRRAHSQHLLTLSSPSANARRSTVEPRPQRELVNAEVRARRGTTDCAVAWRDLRCVLLVPPGN